MPKIHIIISIFIFIWNFPFADNNELEEIIDCSSIQNPTNTENCTDNSNDTISCCFANLTNGTTYCMGINPNKTYFLNYIDKFNYKNEDISAQFDCSQTFKTCGVDNPKELYECREHSTKDKSCCKLSGPGVSNCILSDTKYEEYTNFTLFNNYSIECFEPILVINYFLFVIVLIFIFI